MKLSITVIYVIVVVLDELKFTSSRNDRKFEIDLYYWALTAAKAIGKAPSRLGISLVSMRRGSLDKLRRSVNYWGNFSFAVNYEDAAYFFYEDEKKRDLAAKNLKAAKQSEMTYDGQVFRNGDLLMKYSYYCRHRDPEQLKDYCWWAIHKNRIWSRKFEVDPVLAPECEYRSIYVPQYDFKTWRTLLRCPVVSIIRGEEYNSKANIFIMSVENAFPSRMMYYLFMRIPSLERRKEEAIMSQSQSQSESVEYEPHRASTGNTYDLTERDRGMMGDLEPARHSVSEFDEVGKFSQLHIGSASRSPEIKEIRPQIESSSEARPKQPPLRIVSIRDNVPSALDEGEPIRSRLNRATQNDISRYHQLARSRTAKTGDYRRRRGSLPSRPFRGGDEEEPQKSEPMPLEIVNLVINRRNSIGRQRPQ